MNMMMSVRGVNKINNRMNNVQLKSTSIHAFISIGIKPCKKLEHLP